ncbi:MAG TPA: PH domain-containing protein, partial [Thermomicrobiales bacterium]|nr:PH domain-containing protein [Thermomicrobiales bacterium]
DLEEPPIERVLRLTRLRIETAASGSKDARIVFHSLGQDDAQRFRQELLRARQHAIAGEQPATEPAAAGVTPSLDPATARTLDESELIRKLSTRDLILAGATSGRVGPAAALVGILSQFANEYMPRSWWDHVPWRDATSGNAGIIAGLVVTFGVIVWILAIGSTVLTHAGFELRHAGDQLTIQHGLLERRRSTIPLRRIQAVVLLEGLFRQPFGYGELKFESAGQAGGDDGRSGVLFPFLPMREMESLIARITPEYALEIAPAAVRTLPPRAMQRYVVPGLGWTLGLGVLVNVLFWKWLDGIQWWTVAVFALVPIVTYIRWARYRAAGWFVSPVHLMMRWRTITGRVTMITRVQRLQHRSLTANPFQRRARLVTFRASVASGSSGGHFALPQVDRADAEHLLWQLNRRNARAAAAAATEASARK